MRTVLIGNVRNGDVGEYMGRPMGDRKGSLFANNYRMYDETERQNVIAAFRADIKFILGSDSPLGERYRKELERLRRLAERPGGVTLVCWCAPRRCHTEVIRDFILEGDHA